MFFLVPTGRGALLEPVTAGEKEEVLHWLHDVSAYVPIKTTEAPHYRRVAIQRAGVEALDEVFPVGPLRARLRRDTADVFARRTPRPRQPRAPIDVNAGRGFAFAGVIADYAAVTDPGPTPARAARREERPPGFRPASGAHQRLWPDRGRRQ